MELMVWDEGRSSMCGFVTGANVVGNDRRVFIPVPSQDSSYYLPPAATTPMPLRSCYPQVLGTQQVLVVWTVGMRWERVGFPCWELRSATFVMKLKDGHVPVVG